MTVYGIDNSRVNIDENFINGYLSSLALLRDYTTPHLGYYYSFQRLTDSEDLIQSLMEEIKRGFNNVIEYNSIAYLADNSILVSADQIQEILNLGIDLFEIINWQNNLVEYVDKWLGTKITSSIKEDQRTWDDKPNIFSINFIEMITAYFGNKNFKAYTFDGAITKELPLYWGGLDWLDILFTDQNENYLLHFHEGD